MKNNRILIVAVLSLMACVSFAQEPVKNSTLNALKVKELRLTKTSLEKQIAEEDKKRNQVIDGVTPETQELLNNRQDSICLDLRSQLVEVELELKELVPNKTITNLVNQFNQLQGTKQE